MVLYDRSSSLSYTFWLAHRYLIAIYFLIAQNRALLHGFTISDDILSEAFSVA